MRISSYSQQNGSLVSEIKFSEKRLQRMRAGVKLAQVLEESLQRKYRQVQEANLERIQPRDQTLDQSDIQLANELDIDNGFQKQKQLVEQMIKSSYKQDD